MIKNFSRTIEDFTCEVCGTLVHGNGYTNHCPRCLASKHVDINPGDRASDCQGIMHPVAMETTNGQNYIVHECERCHFTRRNKVAPQDDFNAVLALSNGTIEHYLSRIKKI